MLAGDICSVCKGGYGREERGCFAAVAVFLPLERMRNATKVRMRMRMSMLCVVVVCILYKLLE